jgi:riboflavin synthase
VTGIFSNKFSVEASQETEARTILKSYNKGSKINLERALKVGSRLGGHFVSGHIDCIGVVDTLTMVGDSLKIKINYDKSFDKYVIEKGSIALNGISLTINEISSGSLSVNLIPHSVDNTTVGGWKKGDPINLEFDMIGKYVLNINQIKNNNTLTKDKLFECGW